MELYRLEMNREVNGKQREMEILVLPYFFMRGCPYNCAFCTNSLINGFGLKDPNEVADDLQKLKNKYETKYFFFHNPMINPTYKYAENVAQKIIERGLDIQWSDCASFKPMDKKLLEKLKDSGCKRLVFGFESASPKILSLINKNFRPNKAEKILRKAKKFNIWTELDLICGFPYESDYDTKSTLSFLGKNKEYINACYLNKFWVEGLISRNPEKYGIELREGSQTHKNWATTGFDEIYGIDWEDRIEMTKKTFNRLEEFIQNSFDEPPNIHEFFFKINKVPELRSHNQDV